MVVCVFPLLTPCFDGIRASHVPNEGQTECIEHVLRMTTRTCEGHTQQQRRLRRKSPLHRYVQAHDEHQARAHDGPCSHAAQRSQR